MLERALIEESYDKLIFHSDQGWQYQHYFYQKKLEGKKITQSMSRKGNSLNYICPTFGVQYNDTLAFAVLTKDLWKQLENEFGKEKVRYYFEKITLESKMFDMDVDTIFKIRGEKLGIE